jgi:hypothetical protein
MSKKPSATVDHPDSSKARTLPTDEPSNPTRQAVVSFLDLPRELRDSIYDLILNYDGVQDAISKLNEHFPHAKSALLSHATIPELLRTPGILLANRQIYEEAYHVLGKQKLTITCPLLALHFEAALGLPLSSVITADTLQRVSHVKFELVIWSAEQCADFEDIGLQDHSVGNWEGNTPGEQFLLYSDAWAIFIIACLDVWLDTNNLETMEFRIHDEQNGSSDKIVPIHKVCADDYLTMSSCSHET